MSLGFEIGRDTPEVVYEQPKSRSRLLFAVPSQTLLSLVKETRLRNAEVKIYSKTQNWEAGTDTHTFPSVKQTAGGNAG